MKLEPFTPEWIEWQAGLRRSDPYFLSKIKLVKDFAEYLHDSGERITYQRIRALLSAMDRSYGLSRQEIHWGIYLSRVGGELPLRPNGKRVRVKGTVYQSIRAAAKGEHCRQSAVAERIVRGEPGWSFVD